VGTLMNGDPAKLKDWPADYVPRIIPSGLRLNPAVGWPVHEATVEMFATSSCCRRRKPWLHRRTGDALLDHPGLAHLVNRAARALPGKRRAAKLRSREGHNP
jgi:hypothetical protein